LSGGAQITATVRTSRASRSLVFVEEVGPQHHGADDGNRKRNEDHAAKDSDAAAEEMSHGTVAGILTARRVPVN